MGINTKKSSLKLLIKDLSYYRIEINPETFRNSSIEKNYF